MTNIMNTNTKQDQSNLNLSDDRSVNVNGLVPSERRVGVAKTPSETSNLVDTNQPLLSNLGGLTTQNSTKVSAGASSSSAIFSNGFMPSALGENGYQGQSISGNMGGSLNFNGHAVADSGNVKDIFLQMQNQSNFGSDTDTCASSYAARRTSRDSLVSRDSLSDMLSADQVASNNLAMMNMLASQQQQMCGGNQNTGVGLSNSFTNGQHHKALNQSMSQLMMNGSMNMSQIQNQLSSMSSMANCQMGGWGAGENSGKGMATCGGTPLVIPPKKTKNKHKQTFAQKLMHILSIKECQSAIRWMPNGCAFCIVNSKELVDRVLPKYFKEAKYTSFTRKLNRWGFKHFTLPTSKPSNEKEMSIYTHEKFLRDNPSLCQQMDGGHRRRNSTKDTQQDHGLSGIGQGEIGAGQEVQQELQRQNMMMQQMQQQSMLMQQVQMQMGQNQILNQNQVSSQNHMFGMSCLGSMGAGGGNNNGYDSMVGSSFSNKKNTNIIENQVNGGMNNLMDAMGRRTSLGFMPYLPSSNRATGRRDSGFSIGGMSTTSHDLSNSFNESSGATSSTVCLSGADGPSGSSPQSLEKFHKALSANNNLECLSNAPFEALKGAIQSSQGAQGGSAGGSGGNSEEKDTVHQEEIRHGQARLAALEDMIAKERKKQSLLSGLDSDPIEM